MAKYPGLEAALDGIRNLGTYPWQEAAIARIRKIVEEEEEDEVDFWHEHLQDMSATRRHIALAAQRLLEGRRARARLGGEQVEPTTRETTRNDGPDPVASTGSPPRGIGAQAAPGAPAKVQGPAPEPQDPKKPHGNARRRKRDGSASKKVRDYLVGHLGTYNECMKSGDYCPPLPNQAKLAKQLKVSESTVSRVVGPFLKDYRKLIRAEMVSGWKDKETGNLDASAGLHKNRRLEQDE